MDRYKRYPMRGCSCPSGSVIQKKESTEEYCICTNQSVSLAMAYVKDQPFEYLYELCDALYKGTLFKELYKPYGMGGCRK